MRATQRSGLLQLRTWLRSLMIWKRKPSHLGSCSQSSPLGGRTAAEGDRGRMKVRRGMDYGTTVSTAGTSCDRCARPYALYRLLDGTTLDV